MRRLLLASLLVPVLACSSSSDNDAEIARLKRTIHELRAELQAGSETTSTTSTPPPPGQLCFPEGNAYCASDLNTTTTLPGRLGDAQVLFVELVRTYCDSAPNPLGASFTTDGTLVRVTDRSGDQLLIDLDKRLVTPIDGPEGVIPQPYRSCATHVFLGYADH